MNIIDYVEQISACHKTDYLKLTYDEAEKSFLENPERWKFGTSLYVLDNTKRYRYSIKTREEKELEEDACYMVRYSDTEVDVKFSYSDWSKFNKLFKKYEKRKNQSILNKNLEKNMKLFKGE